MADDRDGSDIEWDPIGQDPPKIDNVIGPSEVTPISKTRILAEDLDRQGKTLLEAKEDLDQEIRALRASLRAQLDELHPAIRRLVLFLSPAIRKALDE